MQLSIIIVHYKTLDLTRRCIASIKESSRGDYEIIVVDNYSQDGAGQLITKEFPEVNWIYNEHNEGFGRANNLGAEKAKGSVLLFLNSDMTIPENCIAQCLEYVLADATIGVFSCKILNTDLSQQRSLFYHVDAYKDILKTNLLIDKFNWLKQRRIEAVLGAFMFIPKEVFKTVGGFDPDFFMYSEELELCRRIRKKGYSIGYTETVHAIHKHQGSTNDSNWSLRQKSASNLLLQRKTKGIFGYLIYPIVQFLNSFTNLLFLVAMDINYRRNFWKQQLLYLRSSRYYFRVLFSYGKKPSNVFLKVE